MGLNPNDSEPRNYKPAVLPTYVGLNPCLPYCLAVASAGFTHLRGFESPTEYSRIAKLYSFTHLRGFESNDDDLG